MPGATVINIKSGEPYDEYIGHQMPPFMSPRRKYLPRSIWRNPFNRALRDGLITCQEALEHYLAHVLWSPDLMARLPELEGKVLACWCKPKACHGDVLVRLLESARQRRPSQREEADVGLIAWAVRGGATSLKEAVHSAADASRQATQNLISPISTFKELPLWLQLILIAIIVVSMVQWQRRRR